VASANRW